MPVPPHLPPMSPLRKLVVAAVMAVLLCGAYAAYLIATFPYPSLGGLMDRCSMSATVISTQDAGASKTRILAKTSSGETIEVTGAYRPAAGDAITVWRIDQPGGHFTYELLENIPPLRK